MKRFPKGLYLAVLGLCWLGAGPVQADQAEDEAAIRKMIASFAAAFNKGDAKALAEHWLPDAIYTEPASGEKFVGRDAIAKYFAGELMETKNATMKVAVDSIRFISPHVAVEQGVSTITVKDKEISKSKYSAIHIKREGKWLLDRVQEEDVPEAISHYDKLKDLAWLVGNWVDNDDDDATTVEVNCKWAKNQNFLIRSFTFTIRNQLTASGMQIIGWDPVEKKTRSWFFDSNGGFGEGIWSKKGNAWYVLSKETTPSGQKASGVTILTMTDDNNFTWEAVDRQAGGQLLPNIAPVPVMRKPVD